MSALGFGVDPGRGSWLDDGMAPTTFSTTAGTTWSIDRAGRSATRCTARGTRSTFEIVGAVELLRDELGDRYRFNTRRSQHRPGGPITTGLVAR